MESVDGFFRYWKMGFPSSLNTVMKSSDSRTEALAGLISEKMGEKVRLLQRKTIGIFIRISLGEIKSLR